MGSFLSRFGVAPAAGPPVVAIGASPGLAGGAIEMERALVLRARHGDARAFRSLFDRHAPGVRRFLRDLTRDATAGDEATQETFVRAYQRLGTLRENDRLKPWLFGIARNVFREQVRARRNPAAPGMIAAFSAGSDPDSLGPLYDGADVDPGPTPEGLLMGREADRLLAEALDELPEERRAALLLRIDHGLDYEEIRSVLGWSIVKVKNEIHRARLTLRTRLRGYLDANNPGERK